MNPAVRRPLYQILGEIAALWAAAMVGYFIILPIFGISNSYNEAPVAIAVYFLFWLGVSMFTFSDLYRELLPVEKLLWVYGVACIAFGAAAWALLVLLTSLPDPTGFAMSPYTDLLLATPWYFLPKGVDIFVQQTLIAALVLALAREFKSVRQVSIAYALCFGSVHILLFILSGAPTPYALVMTIGSLLSAAVFPYLILKVRGGFVYAYMIHFAFYLALALAVHALPVA